MTTLLIVEPEGSTVGDRLSSTLGNDKWIVNRCSPDRSLRAALETAALIVVVCEECIPASPDLLGLLVDRIRAPVVVVGDGHRQVEIAALHAGAAAYVNLSHPEELVSARLEVLLRRHPFAPYWGESPITWVLRSDDWSTLCWPIVDHSRSPSRSGFTGEALQGPARSGSAFTGFEQSYRDPGSSLSTEPDSVLRFVKSPGELDRATYEELGEEDDAYRLVTLGAGKTPSNRILLGVDTGPSVLPDHSAGTRSVSTASRKGPRGAHELPAGRGGLPPGGGPPRRRSGGFSFGEGRPMRRVLMMMALVGILVTGLALANTFDVNSGGGQDDWADISSGGTDVDACNGNVGVDLNGGDYDDTNGDFLVASVDVDANPTCADHTVTVQLTDGGVAYGDPETATLDGSGDATVDFSGQSLLVGPVDDVHVMIDNDPF